MRSPSLRRCRSSSRQGRATGVAAHVVCKHRRGARDNRHNLGNARESRRLGAADWRYARHRGAGTILGRDRRTRNSSAVWCLRHNCPELARQAGTLPLGPTSVLYRVRDGVCRRGGVCSIPLALGGAGVDGHHVCPRGSAGGAPHHVQRARAGIQGVPQRSRSVLSAIATPSLASND